MVRNPEESSRNPRGMIKTSLSMASRVIVFPVKVFTKICMPPLKYTMAKTEDKVEG